MPTDDLDPDTLARLRGGDPLALEACYQRFGGRVYRLAFGMLGQASDAEDATQEVFLKVLERARQFEARSRFTTWLHRLTVNHCLNRLERSRTRRACSLECEAHGSSDRKNGRAGRPGPAENGAHGAAAVRDDRPGPMELAVSEDNRLRIHTLLERLPEEQRAVLLLREIESASYAEIAAALEIPEGTVMSRLSRAREKLAQLLRPGSTGAGLRTTRSTTERSAS